jgi:four helix bundle protein
MMKEESAERRFDLEERLIAFFVQIIDIVEALPPTRGGNHIAGQLIRSGTSPAPSYGEAQSAESRADFIHKMKISLKELRETRVWLLVIQRKNLAPRAAESVECAVRECHELIAIFVTSISTAQNKLKPGASR